MAKRALHPKMRTQQANMKSCAVEYRKSGKTGKGRWRSFISGCLKRKAKR